MRLGTVPALAGVGAGGSSHRLRAAELARVTVLGGGVGACAVHTPNRGFASLGTMAKSATPVTLNESWFRNELFDSTFLSQDAEVGVCEKLLLNASSHIDDVDRKWAVPPLWIGVEVAAHICTVSELESSELRCTSEFLNEILDGHHIVGEVPTRDMRDAQTTYPLEDAVFPDGAFVTDFPPISFSIPCYLIIIATGPCA